MMNRPQSGQPESERTLPSQEQRLSIPSAGDTKIQTDVKDVGGLPGIPFDIDLDIDIDLGLGGGRRTRRHRSS